MKDTPPLEVRANRMLAVVEVLKDLDVESQRRTLEAVAVMMGFKLLQEVRKDGA